MEDSRPVSPENGDAVGEQQQQQQVVANPGPLGDRVVANPGPLGDQQQSDREAGTRKKKNTEQLPPARPTRKATAPIRLARAEIEQAGLSLAERVISARNCAEQAGETVQDGEQAVDLFTNEMGLLSDAHGSKPSWPGQRTCWKGFRKYLLIRPMTL